LRVSDPVDALVLDLLEWIGPGARPYAEVMEAWRTSCPRLPVWEEANVRGYLHHAHSPGSVAEVSVSPLGLVAIRRRRQSSASDATHPVIADADRTA
jgi:D-3-phosphoglycerate dehydrogenase / 2-oxoglutarate reductase